MVSEILIQIKAFRWMMLMAINILSVTHVGFETGIFKLIIII